MSNTNLSHYFKAFSFIGNFNQNFIDEAWKDDPGMAKHFKQKFDMFCTADGYGSANAVFKFVCSLIDHHKEKLFQYIENCPEHNR